ncbi:MAG: ADP-ribosylglycohydrolase family protein [Chloroflexota bacterium]
MSFNRGADLDNGVLARAQGCLLGQFVGDALGSMVEFTSADVIRARYPAGLRVIGPSTVHHTIGGQVTDDSEMALALARSLVARGAFDDEDVAHAYADWRDSDPFDVGGTIGQATSVMGAARSRGAALAKAGRAAANRSSEANGALMRQSPLAIWGVRLDPDALAAFVRADTTLTHPNQVCQDASTAFIVALAATIREGLDGAAAYERALGWDGRHGASPSVTAALQAAVSTRPPYEINGGHVLHALQNAYYQALHASSFEAGIIDTVMHGGDPDTNGAIAGALLGAIHTVEAIPEQWRTAVLECRPVQGASGVRRPRPEIYWPRDALQLVEQLLRAGTPLSAGHPDQDHGPRPAR